MTAKGARTICIKVKSNSDIRIMDQVEVYAREYTKSYTSLVNIRKIDKLLKQMKKMTAKKAISAACNYMLGDNEFQISKTKKSFVCFS